MTRRFAPCSNVPILLGAILAVIGAFPLAILLLLIELGIRASTDRRAVLLMIIALPIASFFLLLGVVKGIAEVARGWRGDARAHRN